MRRAWSSARGHARKVTPACASGSASSCSPTGSRSGSPRHRNADHARTALTVHTTLAAQQQSEETRSLTEAALQQGEDVKRISGWAAILFAPTLVGTIYGMNFQHMPELGWTFGYPLALFAMLAMGAVLYLVFRRKRWL